MYSVVTPAASLAVSVAEFKSHISYSGTDKDTMFELYLKSAISEAELFAGMNFVSAVLQLSINQFFSSLLIKRRPFLDLSEVKYYDVDNQLQSFDVSNFWTETDEYGYTSLILKDNVTAPQVYNRPGAVLIKFTAGMTTVKEDIKAAILLAATAFYLNPSDSVRVLPTASKNLLRNYRSFFS